MKRGPSIVLIGFMGSGKSTVSRGLARRTTLPRYDTDEMIVAQVGLPITEIFQARGEDAFRVLESEALAQIPDSAAIVVTGGGVVLRPEKVQRLRCLGVGINLTPDEETLFPRVSRPENRPPLPSGDPPSKMSELLRFRDPLYRAAADYSVDTSRLRHEQVAEAILERFETYQTSPAVEGE